MSYDCYIIYSFLLIASVLIIDLLCYRYFTFKNVMLREKRINEFSNIHIFFNVFFSNIIILSLVASGNIYSLRWPLNITNLYKFYLYKWKMSNVF